MKFLTLLSFMVSFAFVSMSLVNSPTYRPQYHSSCADIKRQVSDALSGLYDIKIHDSIVTVYCEMALHGGGFTFIPRSAVLKSTHCGLVKQLFTNMTEVLLRFQRKDGLQPHTLISQLPQYRKHLLSLRMHEYSDYTRPLNYYMRDFLLLGILPASVARSRSKQGFLSNGKRVSFTNCDANPNSYFAFFPNHREQTISSYHSGNLVYERRGVAVNWRRNGIASYGHRQLPNDFFFLTELHFGGCGCYTSSDRWREAFGAAIGIR